MIGDILKLGQKYRDERSIIMNVYRFITVEDNLQFKYIVHVMNMCFGSHYEDSDYQAGRSLFFSHIDNETMLWFPKIADKNKKWTNSIAENGLRIIEETDKANYTNDEVLPRITFAKLDQGYKFVGVFKINQDNCNKGHREFIRIADHVDLRKYNKKIDNRPIFEKYADYIEIEINDGDENKPLFNRNEGYKRSIYQKCHHIVFDNITPETGLDQAAKYLNDAVKQSANLIDKHQVVYFSNLVKSQPDIIGELGKELVLSNDDSYIFEKLTNVLKRKYDLVSFFLFIKDCNKYLPVRPTHIEKALKMLGYDYVLSGNCSWENYVGFLSMARDIQRQMNYTYQMNYDLLDTQSFLWGISCDEYSFFDIKNVSKKKLQTNKVTNEAEDNKLIEALKKEKEFKLDLRNTSEAIERKNPVYVKGKKIYPRDKRVSRNALILANHTCEINPEHKSFIRRGTNIKYMEPHHLVPMSLSNEFECSLDREENIVCLCSDCHNRIHYGEDADILIRKLYDVRKKKLLSVGIQIDVEELIKSY